MMSDLWVCVCVGGGLYILRSGASWYIIFVYNTMNICKNDAHKTLPNTAFIKYISS